MAKKAVVHAKSQESKQKCSSFCRRNPGYNSSGSTADRILQLQKTAGNQAVQRLIKSRVLQAKLRVGQPDDIYEQEADRVANEVMRMPLKTGDSDQSSADSTSTKPVIQLKPGCLFAKGPPCGEEGIVQPKPLSITPLLQRQAEEREEPVRMKRENWATPSLIPSVESSINSLKGGGKPLSESDRAFFEPRFGADFSEVRVHNGSKAAETANSINAKAFTVGNNIAFGEGQFVPGSHAGRKLLAHELTHTLQQSRGGSQIVRGAPGWTGPMALSSAPSSIQRKEEILKPLVTEGNPLERMLKGEPPGLTTPLVNGVEFNSMDKVDAALPLKIGISRGSEPDTCRVSSSIDVKSQAKIITASTPGKNGWTTSAPFAILNKIGRINHKDCAAKKGDINVRMVAEIGNEKFARWVLKAEGEHAAVIEENHNKYLKPYHDFVNSKVGSNKDLKECAKALGNDINTKRSDAIKNWAKAWGASLDNLDKPDGPHRPKISFKVVGKCDEILATIKR